MSYCTHCKTILNLMPNPYSRKVSNGKTYAYYMCRPCNAERHKRYAETTDGKKVIASARMNTDHKNPDRARARNLLNYAIRIGKMTSPNRCSDCTATGMIHGHHEDYSKPLEVLWLCPPCHAKHHHA